MRIKHALLLYKKSTLKHTFSPGGREAKGIADRGAFVRRFKLTHTQHYKSVAVIERALKEQGVSYTRVYRGQRICYQEFDFVITLGGDGTFLEAARNIDKQWILGVNSDPEWSVGCFCCTTPDNFTEMLKRIINDSFKFREIHRLQLQLKYSRKRVNVLNDILICHRNPAAMSRYVVTIGPRQEEQRSSGLWVSTAAGSTGAIYSAGGKILPLSSRRMQFRVRELYVGDKIRQPMIGGIVSANGTIKIVSLMKEGYAFLDGSHARLPFPFGEEALIASSTKPLHVITG